MKQLLKLSLAMLLACVLSLGSLTAAFAEAPAEQEPPAAAGTAEPIDTPLSETDKPAAPPAGDPEPPETPPAEPQPGEPEPAGPEAPEKADPDLPEGSGEESDADPEDPQEPGELPVTANALAAPVPVNAPEAEEAEIRSVTVSPEHIENGGTVTVTVEMYYPRERMDNRVVYVDFMRTEDNPLREFDTKCYRQEEPGSAADHLYHFVGTIDVKSYASSGTYRLEYVDDWVNDQYYCSERYRKYYHAYSSTLPIPSGWQASFTVDNKFSADTAPVLKAIEVDPSVVTLVDASGTAEVRLNIESEGLADLDYVDGAFANFKYPDKQIDFGISDFSSQPDDNGFYTATFTIPKHASAGNYQLAYLSIEDSNDNCRVYYAEPYAEDYENENGAEKITGDLGEAVFEVVNPQADNTPPIIEEISIEPQEIPLGQADSIILTLKISDGDGSGFDPRSPEDSIALREPDNWDGPRVRASYIQDETSPSGTYRYSIPLRYENVVRNTNYFLQGHNAK